MAQHVYAGEVLEQAPHIWGVLRAFESVSARDAAAPAPYASGNGRNDYVNAAFHAGPVDRLQTGLVPPAHWARPDPRGPPPD